MVGITTSSPSLSMSCRRARIDRVRPVVDLLSAVGVNCFLDVERVDHSFLLFNKRFSRQRRDGAHNRGAQRQGNGGLLWLM
jgi:hypothetical protein